MTVNLIRTLLTYNIQCKNTSIRSNNLIVTTISSRQNYTTKTINTEVNKFYKNAANNWERIINREANEIAPELKLDDRIQQIHKQVAFVAIKSRSTILYITPNTYCSIHPKITSVLSTKLSWTDHACIQNALGFKHQLNTAKVIEVFNNIKKKVECTYLQFDICHF